MRIEVKGRNVPVTDELREQVERRFRAVSRQVSDLARLEVEVFEERNPAIEKRQIAEAVLYLKGTTLRASERSYELAHAVHLLSDDLTRQVKRHCDMRRKRREARTMNLRAGLPAA